MKKIRSTSQLQLERSKLGQRKLELEKAIRQDWGQLKSEARPVRTAARLFNKFAFCNERKQKDTSTGGIHSVITRFINKWITKKESRFKNWFNAKNRNT